MPANVFMLLSFMGFLKLSGMIDMTSGLMATYDAYVSLGRIEKFLLLEKKTFSGNLMVTKQMLESAVRF